MKNKILSVIYAVCVFLLILTTAISLPIYCRFFYYLHIKPLGLEGSGFTYQQIVDAYNQVLNYLTLPFTEFGTGVIPHSAEGAAHFKDCKVLFMLNAGVFLVSLAVVLTLFILHRKRYIELIKPKGFTLSFYSAICAIVLPVIIGGLAATDFDRAFTVFHHIFFPGKDNWVFSYYDDPIIRVLPQEFFMNCAIFIGVGLILICLSIIIYNVVYRIKKRTRNNTDSKQTLKDDNLSKK